MDKNFTIELSSDEVEFVMQILGNGPYSQVAHLISKINDQLVTQMAHPSLKAVEAE